MSQSEIRSETLHFFLFGVPFRMSLRSLQFLRFASNTIPATIDCFAALSSGKRLGTLHTLEWIFCCKWIWRCDCEVGTRLLSYNLQDRRTPHNLLKSQAVGLTSRRKSGDSSVNIEYHRHTHKIDYFIKNFKILMTFEKKENPIVNPVFSFILTSFLF